MPNWVYNTISVSGNEQDINALVKKMARPYTTHYPESVWVDDKWIENPATQRREEQFSLWNIISPRPEILKEYFGTANMSSMTSQNWYHWNNKHWGTKWDASDVTVDRSSPTHVLISFSTAWSPVTDLLVKKLSPKFAALTFDYEYEEEQGWGGQVTFKNRKILSSKEWDIPNCHADYEERDRHDSCRCQYDIDPDSWYDDCPREGNNES